MAVRVEVGGEAKPNAPPDLAVGRISSRREVPGFAVRESVLLVVRIWLKEAPEPRLESIYRRRNSWHMLLAALPPFPV